MTDRRSTSARRPVGRRHGSSGARDDILRAARELFAERGFERATIRAIAERASVDPALVHHYFGTKDDLLAAALTFPVDPAAVFAGLDSSQPHVGREIVLRALRLWSAPQTGRPLLALVRTGISHERAAQALRDLMATTLLRTLGGLAERDEPELRATLVGAQMGGLLLGRYVIGFDPLTREPPERMAAIVGPVIDHYLHGPLPGRRRGERSREAGSARRT